MKRQITIKALENKSRRLSNLARTLSTNSCTLMNVVDEYNDMRAECFDNPIKYEIWKAYCDKHGYDYSHDGYDTIA